MVLHLIFFSHSGYQNLMRMIGTFFGMFAIFFPAVTGIIGTISGEIRNPRKAIPQGTIMSVVVSTSVYMGLAIMLGATVSRFALTDNFLVMLKLSFW